LISFMFVGTVCASDYLPMDKETLYCERYGITFWCDNASMQFLESLTPEQLSKARYINDYAFSDAVRYTGQLKITDINVFADLSTSSNVEAVYKIQNTGAETVKVHIVALETPENTKLYDNGALLDQDPLLYGWDSTFTPGETREIKLVFTEPLYGEIFGYNVNLLFDGKTTDNHITPRGSFVFRLLRGVTLDQCVPKSYTTKTENGRVTVSWTKTDFVPWTNPFNDLICTWTAVGGAQPDASVQTQQGGDNGVMIWIVAILVVLGGLYWANKTGRLDDIRDRLGI